MLDDAATVWPMVDEKEIDVDEPIGFWLADLPPEVPDTSVPCLGFVT